MGRHRWLIGAVFAAWLAGVGAGVWSVARPARWPAPEPDEPLLSPKERIEADLRLDAELQDPKTIRVGDGPYVVVTLTNTAEWRTHRILKPDHASYTSVPHIHWTVTIDRGDGNWVPVTDERVWRCGYGAREAFKQPIEAARLGPGDRLPIHLPREHEYRHPGRVRLYAHYEYRVADDRLLQRFSPDAKAVMAGVPAFRLTSNPVEFDVVGP